MRSTATWLSAKPSLSNLLYLLWLAAVMLAPILISELLYAALD